MGRKKIHWDEPKWEQVKELCGIQCTAAEICAVMGVCEETLNRLIRDTYKMSFSEYYEKHSANGKASLRRNQFRLSKTNAAMAIFLGKNILGQSDGLPAWKENEDLIRAKKILEDVDSAVD